MKKIFIVVILAIILISATSLYLLQEKTAPFHEHANFAVYLNDVRYNFSQEKYMTTKDNEFGTREFVHMHDMNGGVIHLHKQGITLGMFFDSISMKLNLTCLVLDNNVSYCSLGDKTLKVYVNGVRYSNSNPWLHDLDKILLTFGNDSDSQIQQQAISIPADACIYSDKCEPPPGFMNNESLSCRAGQKSNDSCSI